MPASASPPPSILRVGHDAEFAAAVAAGAGRAFSGAAIVAVADVDAALAAVPRENELLALFEPSADAFAQAVAALDGAGLPRWAVVVFGDAAKRGSADDACETIARAGWTAPLVARGLRSALAQHRLRRENERFRGDLATIGLRVAHDLRTPLGGVMTTAEVVKEILAERAPKEEALLQPIIDSGEGLVKLIERISFFAKAIAVREPPQRFSMETPFWNAFQQLESRIATAGASLAQPKSWPMVEGNAAWLQVVWRNLLANAVQHGGAAVRIEAGWDQGDGGLRFWLRDSGSVAPEKRAALFHPFHRLHEPGAPRGFGLSFVQRLVELQGGRCGYEALEGGGSDFFFTLPAPREA